MKCVGLHAVAQPGGKIPLRVSPTDHVRNVHFADRLVAIDGLGDRQEVITRFEHLRRQREKEIEDSRIGPLVLAKGFVVHKQIADITIAVDLIDPMRKLLGRHRPFRPAAITKPKRDIITEAIILQQHSKVGTIRRSVKEVGASVAKHMICTLGEDGLEAQFVNHFGYVVIVCQLSVAEDLGTLAEGILHQLLMHADLIDEFLPVVQEGQAVVVRLCDKLNAAGIGEALETVDRLRHPAAELFENRPGYAVADTEIATMLFYQVKDDLVGCQVAFVGNLTTYFLVTLIVEVVMVTIEDAIAAESEGLMCLKIKDYRCHNVIRNAKRRPWSSTNPFVMRNVCYLANHFLVKSL